MEQQPQPNLSESLDSTLRPSTRGGYRITTDPRQPIRGGPTLTLSKCHDHTTRQTDSGLPEQCG
jgi:hypothetical protein